jgi:hypothetical protein
MASSVDICELVDNRDKAAFSPGPNRAREKMSVTAFKDLPLADRDRKWDGAAAEKRVRKWAGAADKPNQKFRDAHIWYDSGSKDNFTAYGAAGGDDCRRDHGRRTWRHRFAQG